MQPATPLTREEFNNLYWFNSLQMVMVVNPKTIDWPFMVEMRHFVIKAGDKEEFPGVIANVYLDQMSKIIAQDEEKLEYMADPNLKRLYYDRLIVSVRSLIDETSSTPTYLRNVSPTAIGAAPEQAPWVENMERSSTVASTVAMPLAPPSTPSPDPEPTKETTKEFEHDGRKYKMIIDKNDRQMYYMDGVLTSEVNYAKAASML